MTQPQARPKDGEPPTNRWSEMKLGVILDGAGTTSETRRRPDIQPDASVAMKHADCNADLFGAVDRLYARLGTILSAQARTEMEGWLKRNRKGPHGEQPLWHRRFRTEG